MCIEFTKENIAKFKEFFEKFDNKMVDIFYYIKEHHKNLLEFKQYSSYTNFEITDTSVIIFYNNVHDFGDSTYISIPLEHIYNNTYEEYFEDKEHSINAEKEKIVNNNYLGTLMHGYEGCDY